MPKGPVINQNGFRQEERDVYYNFLRWEGMEHFSEAIRSERKGDLHCKPSVLSNHIDMLHCPIGQNEEFARISPIVQNGNFV